MNDTARMEIAVYPIGTGDSSLTKELANIFRVLDKCELPYQVTVAGTIVEGPPEKLFALARDLHDVVFSPTVERVVTVIKLDEKRVS